MAKQVLVVDDDHNTVKYLSVVLNEHGYDALRAHDGSEGLQKVKQAKPDLIVLDVMMPKKSGFVLFRQLKRDDEFKDIPVLMLSGIVDILEELEDRKEEPAERPYDSLREALRSKVRELRDEGLVRPDMFMDKPVDPEAFIAKVQDLIGS